MMLTGWVVAGDGPNRARVYVRDIQTDGESSHSDVREKGETGVELADGGVTRTMKHGSATTPVHCGRVSKGSEK